MWFELCKCSLTSNASAEHASGLSAIFDAEMKFHKLSALSSGRMLEPSKLQQKKKVRLKFVQQVGGKNVWEVSAKEDPPDRRLIKVSAAYFPTKYWHNFSLKFTEQSLKLTSESEFVAVSSSSHKNSIKISSWFLIKTEKERRRRPKAKKKVYSILLIQILFQSLIFLSFEFPYIRLRLETQGDFLIFEEFRN